MQLYKEPIEYGDPSENNSEDDKKDNSNSSSINSNNNNKNKIITLCQHDTIIVRAILRFGGSISSSSFAATSNLPFPNEKKAISYKRQIVLCHHLVDDDDVLWKRCTSNIRYDITSTMTIIIVKHVRIECAYKEQSSKRKIRI